MAIAMERPTLRQSKTLNTPSAILRIQKPTTQYLNRNRCTGIATPGSRQTGFVCEIPLISNIGAFSTTTSTPFLGICCLPRFPLRRRLPSAISFWKRRPVSQDRPGYSFCAERHLSLHYQAFSRSDGSGGCGISRRSLV